MSSLHVVIVNYRTGRLAVDCLQSVAPMVGDLHGGRVIVVDNDSGDDSVGLIRSAIAERGWSGWAELHALPRNGGFAYGNNAAIARVRELDPDFGAVLLLNPDTVASPGLFIHLAEGLRSNSGVGIVGAAIENENGIAQCSAHRQPSPLTELDNAAQLGPLSRWLAGAAPLPGIPSTVAHECDWVSGACMAVRREVLDAIGPMDEGFFLYFEEVDFCLRARRAGWRCWFVPSARVRHFEGASTGIRAARRPRPGYWYRSRRRFFVKAYGMAGLLAADVLWALGRLSLVIRRALWLGGRAGRESEPARLARDLLGGDFKAIANGELRHIRRIA
jgi:N-acetylglucosaminyl-diphospho-decaprenol L-rhamnosyltransferase